MRTRCPESDTNQQAAWIAFARLEQRNCMVTDHPNIVKKIGYKDADHFLLATEKCLTANVDEVLPLILNEAIAPTMTARELCCAYFLKRLDVFSISPHSHTTYYRKIRDYIPTTSPVHGYSTYLQCRRVIYQGHAKEVAQIIEAFSIETNDVDAGVISIWQNVLHDFVTAEASFVVGNYKQAHENLLSVISTSKALDFGCAIRAHFTLARLLRESGQHEQALQMWLGGDLRARLHQNKDWTTLAIHHLNAVQCALDGKRTDIAKQELNASANLMDDAAKRVPRLQGFQYLREGELATLEERYDDGEARLKKALDFFRDLDPPCYDGLMETKVALGSYALYQNDLRMAWAIIRSLIEEAGERDCLPMRSRALLLQTWFFISSDPPTRASFDNVLERIHMIQNPALMIHALGNLLSYAVKHLDESDQAHLVHRIRGLRPMLEESCYEKLYQQHVTDRFAPAMEERFDRLFADSESEPTMDTS